MILKFGRAALWTVVYSFPILFLLSARYDTPAGMRRVFLQIAHERLAYLAK